MEVILKGVHRHSMKVCVGWLWNKFHFELKVNKTTHDCACSRFLGVKGGGVWMGRCMGGLV